MQDVTQVLTLAEAEKLLPEAMASESQENWQNCCSHEQQAEAEMPLFNRTSCLQHL